MPKKNIHPWPFLSVRMPRKMNSITQRDAPIPMHHRARGPRSESCAVSAAV
jgi:hypothetical protein